MLIYALVTMCINLLFATIFTIVAIIDNKKGEDIPAGLFWIALNILAVIGISVSL